MNESLIIDVVRGKRNWSELKRLGVDRIGKTWTFDPYPMPILISSKDILAGFAVYQSDLLRLKEWASFILAASNLISFDALENELNGNQIIESLWQAASGEKG